MIQPESNHIHFLVFTWREIPIIMGLIAFVFFYVKYFFRFVVKVKEAWGKGNTI